jgi:C4-dicarboxylate transporter DctM subunit
VWGLLLIVVVMGGIYTGIFTPTEAAAMSAVYAFIVAVFVYKDMTLKDVPKVLLGSANMRRCCSTSSPTRCCSPS